MSALSPEQRVAEEAQLRELAAELRELATSTAGADHAKSITGFAGEAEKFANMIRDAVTPELAAAFAAKAAAKSKQWSELKDMLTLASFVEGPDPAARAKELQEAIVQEIECKIQQVADALRALSGRGTTTVFGSIGNVAAEAEKCLADFKAAETTEDKIAVHTRFEAAKPGWLSKMENLQTNVEDGIEPIAPNGSDNNTCESVSDAAACAMTCQAIQSSGDWGNFGGGNFGAFGDYMSALTSGGYCAPAASAVTCTPAAPSLSSKNTTELEKLKEAAHLASQNKSANKTTDDQAIDKLVAYLTDDQEGFLPTLRKAVTNVRDDKSFKGAHEDASELLKQMEEAIATISPGSSSSKLSSAQSAAANVKKHALNLQKYDLYVAKKGMPKIAAQHNALLECSKAGIEIADFVRKQTCVN